jgi:hypothetical protein
MGLVESLTGLCRVGCGWGWFGGRGLLSGWGS